MYQVNNRIQIRSEEHFKTLKERFGQAPESMKKVPGFVSFRLLLSEDKTHVIAETTFNSKEDFINWIQSEHFQKAHGRRKGNANSPDLSAYHIIIE